MDKFALEVLNKVDSFYASSFSHLITITLGLVAFLGVFVPVLTTYYQNRNTKLEKENLEVFIENKLSTIRQEVAFEIRDELLKNFESFEEKQKEELERVVGGICYVQANHQISQSEFKGAANSILGSISSCIKAKDECNLQRGLNMLANICLPNISSADDSDLEVLEEKIHKLRSDIKSLNSNGRYTDSINEIEKYHKALIKRLSESLTETK